MLLKSAIQNGIIKKLRIFASVAYHRAIEFHSNKLFFSTAFGFLPEGFFYAPNQSWMRRLVYLPVDLIKKADNEYWLRSLAYFVKLKSLYKNNTHYNFNLRSLATRLKCSPTCLAVHLKVLAEKELIVYHGRNITFCGLKKLHAKFDKKAKNIGVPVDFKNQYDILRCQIIRFNLSAQEYNIKKSGRQIQYFGNVPSDYHEKTNSCYTGLSAKGVGNLFGLSGATGSRIRKKLSKLGLLRVIRTYSVICSNVSLEHYFGLKYSMRIPVYSRFVEGKVLIERRNRIEYMGAES